MADPMAWTQIPTSILDLGQRTADAEAWANAQRAKIADVWANVQKQAISTMANTWQQGTDAVDHFAAGYSSSPPPSDQTPSVPPAASGPSYNDMAGASSSPTGQPDNSTSAATNSNLPGMGGFSLQTATPLPQVSPDYASNPNLPGMGGLSLNQVPPPSAAPGNIAQALVNRVNQTGATYEQALAPTYARDAQHPTLMSQFTPEQQNTMLGLAGNMVMSTAGGDLENAAGNAARDALTIPSTVQRFEEPGVVAGTVDKPHGLYTTPADVVSPHMDLGGEKATYNVNPSANILTVDMTNSPAIRRGATGSSAGVVALQQLVGDQEFTRLAAMSKPELVTAAKEQFPGIDWSKYYDRQEVLEGLGGQIARTQGYDAIWAPDTKMPEFSEYVGLTKNAFGGATSAAGNLGQDVTRMFHGTGSAFDTPATDKFDPNGLFGPGYYLTSDPRVASSYSNARSTPGLIHQPVTLDEATSALNAVKSAVSTFPDARSIIKWLSSPDRLVGDRQNAITKIASDLNDMGVDVSQANTIAHNALNPTMGGNVRAVNVPSNLRLLDADAPVSPSLVTTLQKGLVGTPAYRFAEAMDRLPNPTGEDIWKSLNRAYEDDPEIVNQKLANAGYDGIRYAGGQRIPLMDQAGQPIEHTAVVVFPQSMSKLTNALSGTIGGSYPAVGGALAGGYIGSQQGNTPQERARNALIGAGLGAAGGYGLTKLGENGNLGRLVGEESGAASIPGTGTTGTPPAEPRAGNVLLNKYVSPDVQQVIADTAAKDPAAMEAARRGVVSDATVQQLAQDVGTSAQKIVDRWKPGQAQNAETLLALRQTLASKSQEVYDAAQAAASGTPADLLNLQLKIREQQAIQEAVSGTTAEAGRALRQFRQTVSSTIQSGSADQMQTLLQRLGGVKWTQDLAQKLSQIDPADATARYQFIRDAMQPKLKDYLTEAWYNAMLSGPHTMAVKTTSETLSLALSPVERLASSAIEQPLARLQGRPVERFMGEAPADVVGMIGGIREGVAKGLYTIQHGFSQSDVLNSDYVRPRAFKGPLGAVVNFPSNLLAAGVEMMHSIAQAGALNAYAFRMAKSEGLAGDAIAQRMTDLRANPTADMLAYAKKYADVRTFQNQGGKFVAWGQQGQNLDWQGIPVGRILVPFFRTPVNLFQAGMARSPMAAFNVGMWRNLAAKDPQAADQLGKWLVGSSIGAAIALEVQAGNITGPAPTTPSEADAWRRQGKTPWSMRIGDKWVSYQRLEPLNQTIGQTATIVNAIQQGQDVQNAAGQLALTIGANVVSQPYMQSLSNFMAALKDPTKAAGQFTQGMASSAVPALARIGAQALDPTVRQVTTPLEAAQADIPGLSQQLPPRLNAFGEPQQRLTSNVSPIGVSQVVNDPVDTELTKYGVEPGFTGKTLRGMDLTRQENVDHQQLAGHQVKQFLTQLINDPRYQQLNDLQKARALQLAITRAKDVAANRFVSQLVQQQGQAAILQRIQQKKLQRLPKAG